MSGIWAVKNDEDNGQVKFQRLSTISQQVEFTEIMQSLGNDVITEPDMTLEEKIYGLAPTRTNVEKATEYMQGRLEQAFKKAGLAYEPEVKFGLGADGSLQIYGDRSDMEKVKSLFEKDTGLADDMKTFIGFADAMPQYMRMLEYQIKYENAKTDAERRALDEEYSDLFDGKDHYDTTCTFSSEGLSAQSEFIE